MKKVLLTALATLALAGQALAGHYASPSAGNCGYCHKVNLITQHAGFAAAVCSKCHNSTAAAVVNTIAAGQAGQAYSCSNCHSGGRTHLDLHNDFMTKFTTMAGYQPNATAAFVQPTSYTAVSPATKQYQVCFKCHGYKGFGAVTNGISGIVGPSGVNFTDQAMEFNTANASFHPILASAGNNRGATNNILSPWTKTSIMTCGDCHTIASFSDPNGPHATASNFLLKGPNTTWNNTLKLGSSSSGGSWGGSSGSTTASGIFCANCHDLSWRNSRFPDHAEGDHNGIPCFSCHLAIPHGGQRMGLLVAPYGASATVGTVTVTDKAPYYQNPNYAQGLYITSYPSATSTWSKSNCGCGGTRHD